MALFDPYSPYSGHYVPKKDRKILYPVCWFGVGMTIAVVIMALFMDFH